MPNFYHLKFDLPTLIATIVFFVSITASAALIWNLEVSRQHSIRNQAASYLAVHAQAIQSSIEHALSATYSLAALVKQGNGRIADFEKVGQQLLPLFPGISAIALSPGGIITETSPLAGNEKTLGFNQFKDPLQHREALLAKDSGRLTLAGPFNLIQGGVGAVGRLPVYLNKGGAQGNPHFWGFTNVVVRFPEILAAAKLSEFKDKGFAYALWRTGPEGDKKQIIAGSNSELLSDPVNAIISVPNGTWTLSAIPIAGWNDPVGLIFMACLGLIFSLLLSYFAKLLIESQKLVANSSVEIEQQQEQLRIAATAFESHEGITVTDENKMIIKVNRAFTLITGYSAAEVLGKTPAVLKSGRHDAKFYREMWNSLNEKHHWKGEIWNRSKSGEIYPEWLNITAILNDAGKVTNYIGSFSNISKFKESEKAIHTLSFYDPLTGLPNRRLLIDRLKDALSMSNRRNDRGAILCIDLDDFKSLNDTLGHDMGDQLLIETAKRIQICVNADDAIARLGSNEFVVVLEGLSIGIEHAAIQAEAIARKIHEAIKQPFDLRGHEYHGKACIGISLFQDHHTSLEVLLKHADSAMFQAKQSGKDKIHFFDADMQEALEERVRLEAMLYKAFPRYFYAGYILNWDLFHPLLLFRWPKKRGKSTPSVAGCLKRRVIN